MLYGLSCWCCCLKKISEANLCNSLHGDFSSVIAGCDRVLYPQCWRTKGQNDSGERHYFSSLHEANQLHRNAYSARFQLNLQLWHGTKHGGTTVRAQIDFRSETALIKIFGFASAPERQFRI
jgi:hypothetical protein